MEFKKVYIEITNICNLSCSFCPTTKRVKKSMTIEEFTHILIEIKPFTKYIYLHLKGEPTYHKNLGDFLKIAKEMGFFVNITTNGTLIKSVEDIFLGQYAPRQINFSLHSFDGEVTSIDKNNYLDNILEFTKNSLLKTNTIISLRLWNFNPKNKESHAYLGNLSIANRIADALQLNRDIMNEITVGRGLKLVDRVYLNSDEEFTWPTLTSDTYEEIGFCYGLKSHLGILCDGSVVPCCLDGEGVINLGNIFDTKFHEIVYGERATNIINGFKNKRAVEELCKKCTFKNRF